MLNHAEKVDGKMEMTALLEWRRSAAIDLSEANQMSEAKDVLSFYFYFQNILPWHFTYHHVYNVCYLIANMQPTPMW